MKSGDRLAVKTTHLSAIVGWLTRVIKYVTIFLLVYLLVNWWRAPAMPQAPMLSYQETATGEVVDLISTSHDKAVLVYFWGSWCHVCQFTSPNVQTVHELGQPVLSVAVASGTDSELISYMQQKGYSFATLNDDNASVFHQWQGRVTPSFVIVKDGKATQSFTGITPLWSLKLRLWWANLWRY